MKEKNKIMIVKQNNEGCFCYVCGKQLLGRTCVTCNKKRFIQSSTQYYMAKISMLLQFHDKIILSATDNNSGLAEDLVERCKFLGLVAVDRKGVIIKRGAQELPGVETVLEKIGVLKQIREEE